MPNHPLQIAPTLQRFIEDEVLPGTGIEARTFWQGFSALVHDLAPQNRALLAERERLQAELDNWHRQHPGPIRDMAAYQQFLQHIGYLVEPPASVQVSTRNVDREIAVQAGPQLVVPLSNARYALNAANARWGSLYDALYGDFAVDVAGTDLHACRGLHKVADALQEVLVGGHVTDRAGVLAVPVVQFCLQALALGEQGAVLRCEVVDQGAEALPEGAGLDAGAGEDFVFDEALQGGGDLEWMVWHCLLYTSPSPRD